eukprot:scaffold18214_cov33-Attheya_sp.AAC.5
MAHVNPPARPARMPTTRRYHSVCTKRAAIYCPIIDALHAHYQNETENDSKYPRNALDPVFFVFPEEGLTPQQELYSRDSVLAERELI